MGNSSRALRLHTAHCEREVVGKGGTGQGFKDPKSQPRAAELGEGQSLWQDPLPSEALTAAHNELLSKKEQHELGIGKPISCTSLSFGAPSHAFPRAAPTSP